MTALKDRVVKYATVDAAELRPHPKNWRLHPDYQRNAMETVLADVGVADAVIVRETPDGLELIDGHLRQETMNQQIPVIIVDLDDEEAEFLLAVLDPLAAMAGMDKDVFEELAAAARVDSDEMEELLADIGLNWLRPGDDDKKTGGERESVFARVSIPHVLASDAPALIDAIRRRLGEDVEIRAF